MESVKNAELESSVDFRQKWIFSTLTWNVNNRYPLLSIASTVKNIAYLQLNRAIAITNAMT